MNTTNLFVELLVIGLGPVIAIAMLAQLALDPAGSPLTLELAGASWLAIAIPGLGLMYVLGIITDRLADWMFRPSSGRIRRRHFDSPEQYHDARRTIVLHSEMMYRLRQYGRSRMRIARGWTVNSFLLLVVGNVWVAAMSASSALTLLVNAVAIVLLVGSAQSWRSLSNSEYRKIRAGADFIRQEMQRAEMERGSDVLESGSASG